MVGAAAAGAGAVDAVVAPAGAPAVPPGIALSVGELGDPAGSEVADVGAELAVPEAGGGDAGVSLESEVGAAADGLIIPDPSDGNP
jgi:hypothetical protein